MACHAQYSKGWLRKDELERRRENVDQTLVTAWNNECHAISEVLLAASARWGYGGYAIYVMDQSAMGPRYCEVCNHRRVVLGQALEWWKAKTILTNMMMGFRTLVDQYEA